MKVGRDRHGRKEALRRDRTIGNRSRRAVLHAGIAALSALALLATSAQAATGGASTIAYGGGAAGGDIAFSPMRSAGATWYGPGFYGNQTACGEVLRPTTIGVANRNLPCGTTLKFAYHGHYLITKVIDRGPYTKGNAFDLTNGARMALGFEGSDRIQFAVALELARHQG